MAAAVTAVDDEAPAKALRHLEEFLVRTPDRQVFSRTEVQDLLLDLHLILDPIPADIPPGEMT